MIEKIDQIVPVRFSEVAPGEYFGVILDGDAGRQPPPKASSVWRCQKLPGPGARFRLLFGGKLSDLPPADEKWTVRHMPSDLKVHSYPDGLPLPSDEPKFEDYPVLDARRFGYSSAADRNPRPGLLEYSASSVLYRLGLRMTSRLRTVTDHGLRFVHLCDYTPSYTIHSDPDDQLCHVQALDDGLRDLCDTLLDTHKLVGKAIRSRPFLSALPDIEPQIFASGACYRLEDFGLDHWQAKRALDRLARSDRQYRQLCGAAESVLRAQLRQACTAAPEPTP
jgi:hypothetical protein